MINLSEPRETHACLRWWGDDLDPDELTAFLGQQPTTSERKGDVLVGKVTSQKRTAKTGSWLLRATERSNGNLNDQIVEILNMLTNDLTVWHGLTAKFEADFFCGIFLRTSNDGLSLKASTVQMLAERGLKLELDIYDPMND